MSTLNPSLSLEAATAIALQHFNLEGVLTPLPSYDDQNFRLTTHDGAVYVLRIANAAVGHEALALQLAALAHIEVQAPELAVPRVLPSVGGATIVEVEGPEGRWHHVHILTYLPGKLYADVSPHGPELWERLGAFLGRLNLALSSFEHPGLSQTHRWNLRQTPSLRGLLPLLSSERSTHLVGQALDAWDTDVVPILDDVPQQAIHGDANEFNVLVHTPQLASPEIAGLIDFGDLSNSARIAEVAIAAAYASLGTTNPLAVARAVVMGYHRVHPLLVEECQVLWPMMQARLAMSITYAAERRKLDPKNTYASASEDGAWTSLEYMAQTPNALAAAVFREACGFSPVSNVRAITQWLDEHADEIHPVVQPDPRQSKRHTFDLSVGSPLLAMLDNTTDPVVAGQAMKAELAANGAAIGIGRYGEARLVYTSPHFTAAHGERRSIHLGVDLFMPAGTPVCAPLAGTVHSFADNDVALDYGPTVILSHEPKPGLRFYTLYGHLSRASLNKLHIGQPIGAGQVFAWLGDAEENGGWVPHLHLQLITDMLGIEGNYPGVALPSQRAVWEALSPNPSELAGVSANEATAEHITHVAIESARAARLSPNLSTSYRKHLHIVKGRGAYLYDAEGRAFLDCVNNVCHVGHCHPHVVRAAQQQMAVLNTNTRYLHTNITTYAERLLAHFPEPLEVCFFVNSGSEANDLALRLAYAATGAREVITVDGAYHGHLVSLIDISPYKHDGPGGEGTPSYVSKTRMPNPYRGGDKDAALASIATAIADLKAQGKHPGAFICESILSCGGQIVLPSGYLKGAYEMVREAGGVTIADEVQVGFGRAGSAFWAFETQGVVPDIVTMAKPIGNGHPLGAVVTTRAIADAFHNGMEYFNTYGGNPVSSAVGLAVLDVIEQEGLQAHAHKVGGWLLEQFHRLQADVPLIGDVRGLGLFLGLELVTDRATKAPAAAHASYLVERMRDHGILLSTDGPIHNVIKMKPPLAFGMAEAERLVETLQSVLAEDALQ